MVFFTKTLIFCFAPSLFLAQDEIADWEKKWRCMSKEDFLGKGPFQLVMEDLSKLGILGGEFNRSISWAGKEKSLKCSIWWSTHWKWGIQEFCRIQLNFQEIWATKECFIHALSLPSDPDTNTALKIENTLTLPNTWEKIPQNLCRSDPELCPWPELIWFHDLKPLSRHSAHQRHPLRVYLSYFSSQLCFQETFTSPG